MAAVLFVLSQGVPAWVGTVGRGTAQGSCLFQDMLLASNPSLAS